jgi:hypothetical protein
LGVAADEGAWDADPGICHVSQFQVVGIMSGKWDEEEWEVVVGAAKAPRTDKRHEFKGSLDTQVKGPRKLLRDIFEHDWDQAVARRSSLDRQGGCTRSDWAAELPDLFAVNSRNLQEGMLEGRLSVVVK